MCGSHFTVRRKVDWATPNELRLEVLGWLGYGLLIFVGGVVFGLGYDVRFTQAYLGGAWVVFGAPISFVVFPLSYLATLRLHFLAKAVLIPPIISASIVALLILWAGGDPPPLEELVSAFGMILVPMFVCWIAYVGLMETLRG